MVKTVIVVQARMASTRLPGKVLMLVLGKPLIEYQLDRLSRVQGADTIVVATTLNPADEPIVDLCRRLGVLVYRGSEEDVLSRYHSAACEHGADVVVRVTSDCPLIDPAVIDEVISAYSAGDCDYASNTLERSFPRGMDTEVFSFRALDDAFHEAKLPHQREHVTPFVHQQPARYRLRSVCAPSDWSANRWTVDTAEDFELVSRIIEALCVHNSLFTLRDALEVIRVHPDWARLNAHVEQKKVGR